MPSSDQTQIAIGREYVIPSFSRLESKTIILRGDSTVQGGGWDTGNNFQQALTKALKLRRVRAPTIVNKAVGGTTWANINMLDGLPSGDVSALTIVKSSLNDAGYGLPTLISNMTAKIDELRSSTNGSYDNHPVLIIGPNVADDTPNGRDAAWIEDVQQAHIDVCREYQCAYYDTDSFIWDAVVAANIFMDDPWGDGRSVHPKANMNALYINDFMDKFFPLSSVEYFIPQMKTLDLMNGWAWLGSAYQPPMMSVTPSGRLELHGMIGGGTNAASTQFAYLPVGYRPSKTCQALALSQTAAVGINISSSGYVSFQSSPSQVSVSLNGVGCQID